ncbi:MAG: hypothetical protein BWZ10_03059 [candidate division BRC1 bacterium ADurb.BinA364]|nr:MAG: hypothetical protein BWZ10_03059 [candidate division BRC1 bacterium ADurb.BinA364]
MAVILLRREYEWGASDEDERIAAHRRPKIKNRWQAAKENRRDGRFRLVARRRSRIVGPP